MKKKPEPLESYLVFARKFRPQTFDEVIGQEPITTTLKNAIEKNRVAQSFLFTGSRGVGKTSTARILAKALNCEKGPTAKPCNQCVPCGEITRGTSLDILEIDGASNRGIEEIRTLRENVKFKPAHGRYKVYIIDEVHMLTGEAFNALLKTLEEPPEHVKFIFATTEAHKVPLTILSRCQRFNFKRISVDVMAKKLREVAKEEGVKISEEAILLIARQAEGSLRDAESLLDQLASFAEGEIKESDVAFSLGLTESDLYFSLLDSLREKDFKAVLRTVVQAVEQGKDLVQFAKGLLELFRNLMVLGIAGENEGLVETTEEEIARLGKYAKFFSREELLFSVTLLQQLAREVRWSDTPRFLIESCLLKIASRSDLKAIEEVLKELKTVKGNVPPAPSGSQTVPKSAVIKAELRHSEKTVAAETNQPHTKHRHPEAKPKDLRDSLLPSGAQKDGDPLPPLTLTEVGRIWPELLGRVKAVKMSCGTYLSESEPVEVTDGIVVFGLPAEFKFHRDALDKQDNKDLVRSTLTALLGRDAGVAFVVTEPVKEVAAKKPGFLPQASVSAHPRTDPSSGGKDADIITSALNIFEGGKVVRRDPV